MTVQPSQIDTDENWSNYLEKLELSPYFKISGMALTHSHLIVACKNHQLLKLKFQPEKPEDMGKISFLTQPCQQGTILGIASSLKMQSVYTVSSDKTISKWEYSAANSLELSYQ